MEKLKPLLPVLKEKKRYVVFSIISKKNENIDQIFTLIEKNYKKLFGEFGLADAGLMYLKNKSLNNKGIIRINRKCVDKLKTSFTLLNEDFIVDCAGISGILKKAEYKYVKNI
ncbi:hypothetical protein HOD20_01170 [archaeon]|jgi:RNase P/RNase MRP subunit POP5|nr:hypothetical protein [archaeon]MBT4351114.1 hypothetical protein [archaeon]MBT4648068.1 hypothetical protein [archaeon]MBT6822506.1 hypothetical protein [archaeon]MBT7392507.1 hypothetical protein [archaeon]